MKLKTYIEARGLTVTAFAKAAGLEVSTAHRAVTEKVMPSPATIRAILKATNGEVTSHDFFTDAP